MKPLPRKPRPLLPPPPTGRPLKISRPALRLVPNSGDPAHGGALPNHESQRLAGFGRRTVALLLDAALLAIANNLVQQILVLAFAEMRWSGNRESLPLFTGLFTLGAQLAVSYFVYWKPLLRTGQSYGKKWTNIQIVSLALEESPSVAQMLKREIVGKTLSTLCLGVGYLMALGAKKQTLHDRIFHTCVVVVGR